MKPGEALICPSCGARNKPKWEFCVRCGESLQEAAVESARGAAPKPASAGLEKTGSAGVPWGMIVGLVVFVGAGIAAVRTLRTPEEATADSRPSVFTVPTLPATRAPQPAGAAQPAISDALRTGRALLAGRDAPGALPHLAQAVSEMPDNAEAHHLYAKALQETGSPDDALAQYREAARLSPQTGLYQGDLAKSLAAQGQKAEAIAAYEAAIEAQPRSPGYLRQLAQLKSDAGQADEAIGLLEQAAELDQRSDIQEEMGYALERSGRTAEAIAAYRRAVDQNPASVVGRGRLAELMFKQGQRGEAISLVRAGIQQSPTAAELHRSLGSLLERSGQTREAAAAYREYVRLAPSAADAGEVGRRASDLEKRGSRPAGS